MSIISLNKSHQDEFKLFIPKDRGKTEPTAGKIQIIVDGRQVEHLVRVKRGLNNASMLSFISKAIESRNWYRIESEQGPLLLEKISLYDSKLGESWKKRITSIFSKSGYVALNTSQRNPQRVAVSLTEFDSSQLDLQTALEYGYTDLAQEKISNALKDDKLDCISWIEQTVKSVAKSDSLNTFGIALALCRTIIQEKVATELKKNASSKKEDFSFDPKLEMLLRLYAIYKITNQEESLLQILQEQSIQTSLPELLQHVGKDETAITILKNCAQLTIELAKNKIDFTKKTEDEKFVKISKEKNWKIVAMQDEEGISHLYRKSAVLGSGCFKKVHRLIPLSSSHSLAQATRNTPPEGRNISLEEWDERIESDFTKEREISSRLRKGNVPNIVKIWSVSYKGQTRNMMELCNKGDLSAALSIDKTESRLALGKKLTAAIAGMHRLNLCHLDLKANNIFLKQEEQEIGLHLGDFGATETCASDVKIKMCSTYPAPENVLNYSQMKMTSVTPELDLWVLADLLHLLKFGTSPLSDNQLSCGEAQNTPQEFLKRAEALCEKMKNSLGKSEDPLDRCIAQLFSMDPKDRPSASDVLKLFECRDGEGVIPEAFAIHDEKLALKRVKTNGLDLRYVCEELRGKEDIVFEAVQKNGAALKFVSGSFNDNEKLVSIAVKKNGFALKYASKRLQGNEGIVLLAMGKYKQAIKFATKELQTDKDIEKLLHNKSITC